MTRRSVDTHGVPFFQQKLGQVGAILSGDARNEGYFAIFGCHCRTSLSIGWQ